MWFVSGRGRARGTAGSARCVSLCPPLSPDISAGPSSAATFLLPRGIHGCNSALLPAAGERVARILSADMGGCVAGAPAASVLRLAPDVAAGVYNPRVGPWEVIAPRSSCPGEDSTPLRGDCGHPVELRINTLAQRAAGSHPSWSSSSLPGSLLSSRIMDSAEPTPRHVCCDGCGQSTPSHEIVHYGSIERRYRRLCSRCFNTQMAEAAGLEGFQDAKFEPVGLTDCMGELHEFHFRTHLFGTGVALDAFELRQGDPVGYFFQIIGDPEDDLWVLLGRLVEKMRRALSVQHLRKGDYGLEIADPGVVRGRIECDGAHDGRLPLLVIDGQEID